MELPKINEDLRNFFLPRKYVAPEPEVVPEVSLGLIMYQHAQSVQAKVPGQTATACC